MLMIGFEDKVLNFTAGFPPHVDVQAAKALKSRWWFHFLIFTLKLGEMSHFADFFQRG